MKGGNGKRRPLLQHKGEVIKGREARLRLICSSSGRIERLKAEGGGAGAYTRGQKGEGEKVGLLLLERSAAAKTRKERVAAVKKQPTI